MIRAFLYLQTRSLKNRIVSRVRRLREPRYLVGGLVGLLYFGAMFARPALDVPRHGAHGFEGWEKALSSEARAAVECFGAWAVLGMLLLTWVLPSRRAALSFSEAEIQFLFPAPISRRGLLHYKLLSWQAGLLFAALILCLANGRFFQGVGAVQSILGWWAGLLLVQLHGLGASFVRARVDAAGYRAFRWMATVLVVAACGWIVTSGIRSSVGELGIGEDWHEFAGNQARFVEYSSTWPVRVLLEPWRWLVRAALVRQPGAYWPAMGGVMLLVGLHYAWVLRAAIAFEEASVEAARVTAEKTEVARQGGAMIVPRRPGKRRGLFPLNPRGVPWLALTWKNLIQFGVDFRGRALALVLTVLIPLLIVGRGVGDSSAWPAVVSGISVVLLLVSVLIGPGVIRCDLRLDLRTMADVLRVQPLEGWQVVLGGLLAPWLVLGVAQIILCAFVALWAPSNLFGWAGEGMPRLGLFLSGACLFPALAIVGLVLQNAAALMFPAWVLPALGSARGGLEATGQQILVFFGLSMAFLIALIPATMFGALVFAPLFWWGGAWVACWPASATAAVVLVSEAGLGILWLGRVWSSWIFPRSCPPERRLAGNMCGTCAEVGRGADFGHAARVHGNAADTASGIGIGDERRAHDRTAWILLACLLGLRVVYAAAFPLELAADESYYWDWGRRPDIGYFSKPPMIGWLMGLVGWIGRDSMFALKLAPGILATAGLGFIYLLGRDMFGGKVGIWAVALMAATPANVALNTFFTIDAPLFLFTSASLWLAWRWLDARNRLPWSTALVLALGLGYLSKQIHLLFPVWWCLFLGTRHTGRTDDGRRGWAWLWSWGMIVAASLLFLVPPLWWNSRHGWITFHHTADELSREFDWARCIRYVADFLGGQAGLGGGMTWALMVFSVFLAVRHWRDGDDRRRYLAWFSAPGWLAFLGLSFYQRIEQNWPLVFYVPAVVLAASNLVGVPERAARGRWSPGWRFGAVSLGGTLGVMLMGVPFVVPSTGWAGAKVDATARLRGWRELARGVDAIRKAEPGGAPVFLVAPDEREIASSLAYYLPDRPRTWTWDDPVRPRSQYGIWGRPPVRQGGIYLVVTEHPDSPPSREFRGLFSDWRDAGTIEVRLGRGGESGVRDRIYHVFWAKDPKAPAKGQ